MMSGGIGGPNSRPLIDWLLGKHPDTPKTRAKQWILAGRVRVKGEILRKPQLVISDPGEGLELLDRRSTTLDCGAGWQIHPRVSLLYLDSALAVVNKGPGLISVPAPNTELSALSILQDFLAGRIRAVERGVASATLPPAYRRLKLFPVHRLDQYTSGVFCIACNPTARENLIEQLRKHTMQREYIAFAEGRATARSGTWRNWVELSKDQMRQHLVSEARAREPQSEAQEAITKYEVVAEYPLPQDRGFVTKLRLRLETGRKHQIRLQAASAGLPLVGDRKYGLGSRHSTAEARIDFPRQALHAESLRLEHPEQRGRILTWRATMPRDLLELERALRNRDGMGRSSAAHPDNSGVPSAKKRHGIPGPEG